ncbi:MAG: phosphatase PAP2 family protein, partial [Candidatus Latescibacteria bacterium]|nr:phosphatase PAP2 family protein [bacterium]MBD3425196.1 phosphatase PAP2 family protein [Candidatus Latescibacterota bacterium]
MKTVAKKAIVLLLFLAVMAGAVSAEKERSVPDSTSISDKGGHSRSAWEALQGESSPDTIIFRFINGTLSNRLLDRVMPFMTDFDNFRIIVLLIWSGLVIFGGPRGRWAALALIPVVAASDQISSSLLKPLFARLRPCEVLGSVHFWNDDLGWITTPAVLTRGFKSSFSFPSGHAANITASMVFLGLVYRRSLIPLCIIAALVSLSRIYTGVHWPLDTVAGII